MVRFRWVACALATSVLGACTFPDVGFRASGGGGQGGQTTTAATGGFGGATTVTTVATGGAGTGGAGTGGAGTGGAGSSVGGGLNCIDADNDEYVDPLSSAGCLGTNGFKAENDCDDSDYDVHPGQLAWFDKKTAKGSWDYDCSNGIETLFPITCNATKASLEVGGDPDKGCGNTWTKKTAVACITSGTDKQLCH